MKRCQNQRIKIQRQTLLEDSPAMIFIYWAFLFERSFLLVDIKIRLTNYINQRGRNEFESGGGHTSGAKRRKCFCRALHFLALRVQWVVLVSAFVMVSTVW